MNIGIVVVIVVVIVALCFAFLGNPFASEAIVLEPPTTVSDFGSGSIHQVRPTDVRIRIANSHLAIPPAIWTIEVYNAASKPTTFQLSYARPSGDLWPGYAAAPTKTAEWVVFPKTITVEPKAVGSARVTLTVPAGAVPKDTNFEFWIIVAEVVEGNVGAEVGVRWLVEIR